MNQTMPFNATQATNGNNNMIDTMSNNNSIGENPIYTHESNNAL